MPALTTDTVRTLSQLQGPGRAGHHVLPRCRRSTGSRAIRTTCTSSTCSCDGRAEQDGHQQDGHQSVHADLDKHRAPRPRRDRSITRPRRRDVLVQRGRLLDGDRAAGARVEPGRRRARAPRAPARVGARRVRALRRRASRTASARVCSSSSSVRSSSAPSCSTPREEVKSPAPASRGRGRVPPVPGRAVRPSRHRAPRPRSRPSSPRASIPTCGAGSSSGSRSRCRRPTSNCAAPRSTSSARSSAGRSKRSCATSPRCGGCGPSWRRGPRSHACGRSSSGGSSTSWCRRAIARRAGTAVPCGYLATVGTAVSAVQRADGPDLRRRRARD